MWAKHGLHNEPKIVLLETNQIIPDKNYFTRRLSRFRTNTSDTRMIELGTSTKQVTTGGLVTDGITSADESNYLTNQPGATSHNIAGELEHGDVNGDGYKKGAVTLMSGNDNNFPTNAPRMGYQNEDGKFERVTSISEMNMYNSIIDSMEANRKQTNIMQEGYTNT